ncbi:MAG: hypothetical protein GY820_44660 [Gammaproteobacteria bacterium]|nr:hypothetical protein [Gammaproteobacteria bacterium]
MDLTKTPLFEKKTRKLSKKHDLGEIVCCYVCKRRVGIRQAINCTTDCGRYRHRHCLTTETKAVNRCLSCVAVTQIAKSPDPVRLDRLLQGVCSGLEEECDSDNDSLNSQRVTPSSRQSSVESDAGEDTVVYRAKGDEIWQGSGANSTLLRDTSDITTPMQANAMQQMLDVLF